MPSLRRAGSLAAALSVSLAGITCRDMAGPTGPGRVAPTAAALAFSSVVPTESGEPVIPVQLARVRLFRLPGESPERAILDTVVPFNDVDNSKTMTIPLTLTMVSERFGIELSLLDDRAQVIYLARDTVVAYTTDAAPVTKPIVLRYAGPDTAVVRIALAPGDTTLAIGDAVSLRAVAYLRDGAKTSAWFGFAVHGSSAITVDKFGVLERRLPSPRDRRGSSRGSRLVPRRLGGDRRAGTSQDDRPRSRQRQYDCRKQRDLHLRRARFRRGDPRRPSRDLEQLQSSRRDGHGRSRSWSESGLGRHHGAVRARRCVGAAHGRTCHRVARGAERQRDRRARRRDGKRQRVGGGQVQRADPGRHRPMDHARPQRGHRVDIGDARHASVAVRGIAVGTTTVLVDVDGVRHR